MHGSFTLRALLVGLVIGVFIALSNTYYGLQIGAASQMSMVSGLLGHAIFQLFSRYLRLPFTPAENVLVVSVATATGCMPITAGLIGVIPALEHLLGPDDNGPLILPWSSLFVWSTGLCFFGLISASLYREYFIVQENLPWPGARATAQLISTLHHKKPAAAVEDGQFNAPNESDVLIDDDAQDVQWKEKLNALFRGTAVSGLLSILMFFAPILRQLPIFGNAAADKWLWRVDLAPGFLGQGIITGPVIPLHMLLGAIVGWGILSPYAKHRGWAPGDVEDWATGSRGWIIWVSLAALLADASVKLSWTLVRPIWARIALHRNFRQLLTSLRPKTNGDTAVARLLNNRYTVLPQRDSDGSHDSHQPLLRVEAQHNASTPTDRPPYSNLLLVGFIASVIACVLSVRVVFSGTIPWFYTVLAILLSLPMAVVGIRSLAETDYNPESALVSQLIFAWLASSQPNAIIVNLVSAALAQAGANQAGGISYDFKVGHLVGTPLGVQIPGQIIGSVFGAFISCGIYKLYTTQYTIPGRFFQVPAAFVVFSTAKLLLGRGLPEGVLPFVFGAATLSAVATIVKMRYSARWWQPLIPSGVSFAIGIYNTPSFTITRAIGGLLYHIYKKRNKGEGDIIVFSSGLILGESVTNIAILCLTTLLSTTKA
ncbi:OPT superfamily oligopeptide transporter [Xylaria intraflava]|nr:OPT superfamily oligopeptide transporter [Xylaria intraflava]